MNLKDKKHNLVQIINSNIFKFTFDLLIVILNVFYFMSF